MKYRANDILKAMSVAHNYNDFLISYITKYIKKYNYNNLLDFGCSDGFFIKKISKKVKKEIYGVEKDEVSLLKCEKDSIKIKEEIKDYDFNFDLIYSLNVLEHIKNDEDYIKKFYEKLNKNGRLILYVPALQFLYSSMDKKVRHFRRYTKKDLKNKLINSGFYIEKIEYCDCIGVIATLLYILKDKIKSNKGNISKIQIALYDVIFPISRFLDNLLFNKIIGKNLIAIAIKK